METIFLNDFLDDGILREKVFRQKVADVDWSQYSDKRVLIKGCSEVPIPTWAYLISVSYTHLTLPTTPYV